jgi:hypothetical protein
MSFAFALVADVITQHRRSSADPAGAWQELFGPVLWLGSVNERGRNDANRLWRNLLKRLKNRNQVLAMRRPFARKGGEGHNEFVGVLTGELIHQVTKPGRQRVRRKAGFPLRVARLMGQTINGRSQCFKDRSRNRLDGRHRRPRDRWPLQTDGGTGPPRARGRPHGLCRCWLSFAFLAGLVPGAPRCLLRWISLRAWAASPCHGAQLWLSPRPIHDVLCQSCHSSGGCPPRVAAGWTGHQLMLAPMAAGTFFVGHRITLRIASGDPDQHREVPARMARCRADQRLPDSVRGTRTT